jgi:ABC-2 type transport system ATP-binding protein
VLVLPADAPARDFAVTSFDGTRIEAHFFPARAGSKAPTILYGPGWGNAGNTNMDRPTNEADGTVGFSKLRGAGYNVLTWDPRGFGNSGGEAKWDSPAYEARDVQALMDALAGLPEAKLDAPGDPVVGMAGASYGGGIQWVTAAIDDRVDAITPVVAWHSLVSSLYKAGIFKAGWGSVLCGLGSAGGSTGLVNPDGVQAGSMDSHMYSICSGGMLTGRLSSGDRGWLDERGPGATWMGRVRAPALVLHGTVDTLFTLQEAIDNFRVLRENGVPARMMWFCGGHGRCQTGRGAERYFEAAVLRWLGAYLKGGDRSATGPRFEWLDQRGEWHQASDYPLAGAGTITATGRGLVRFVAGDAGTSGTATAATPSASGIDIPVPRADGRADLVGAPVLDLDYRAYGTRSSTHVYAQIVDVERDVVLGGQVTPIPIELDGQQRTLELNLEPVAYALSSSSRLRLELIPATNVYGNQRATGSVDFTGVTLRLPLGKDPGGTGGPRSPSGEGCTPSFRPRSVRRRGDGRVRLRPRVRCGGERLRKRVRISDGKHRWSRRTGKVARLRVRPRAHRLRVRFRHEGRKYRVRVPIER